MLLLVPVNLFSLLFFPIPLFIPTCPLFSSSFLHLFLNFLLLGPHFYFSASCSILHSLSLSLAVNLFSHSFPLSFVHFFPFLVCHTFPTLSFCVCSSPFSFPIIFLLSIYLFSSAVSSSPLTFLSLPFGQVLSPSICLWFLVFSFSTSHFLFNLHLVHLYSLHSSQVPRSISRVNSLHFSSIRPSFISSQYNLSSVFSHSPCLYPFVLVSRFLYSHSCLPLPPSSLAFLPLSSFLSFLPLLCSSSHPPPWPSSHLPTLPPSFLSCLPPLCPSSHPPTSLGLPPTFLLLLPPS